LSKIKIAEYVFHHLSYTYTYVLSKSLSYKTLGTSSTESLVAAARPSIAVVSVGLASPYGHPDRNVVERWRASGAQVLQTGRRGTITVSTDGRDLKVETFVRE
jgi:beta-lactamase superfamily II metal-dependent hydrolase